MGLPLVKVRPEPKKIDGHFQFYCETCRIEWMLRLDATEMHCPDCGVKTEKIVHAA